MDILEKAELTCGCALRKLPSERKYIHEEIMRINLHNFRVLVLDIENKKVKSTMTIVRWKM